MARKRSTPLVPPDDVRRRYAEVLAPEEAAALQLLFALRETTHRVDSLLTDWLGKDALTPGRLQVLAVLWSRDTSVPQRDIVEALKVSRANVSILVDSLRREGHVLAQIDPADGRHMLVALTPAGRATTDRLVRETAAKLRRSFGLDDDQLLELAALISRLLE